MNLYIPNIDLINIGILTAVILALLAAIELFRRRRQFSDAFSRKSVHVLTGFLIFFAPLLFPRAGAVVLIAAMFVLLNLLAYRQGWLRSVHHTSRQSYGTVYYPLSLLILAAFFWDSATDLVVTSIMVMALGDAAAGLVGESIRNPHRYSVTSDPKSVEGSIAMFVGSFIAMLISLNVYDGGFLMFAHHAADHLSLAIGALLAIALFVTGWESASSRGLDNLTVPLAAAFALHLCFGTQIPDSSLRFLTAVLLGAGIAILAWKLRMLTISGAMATFLLASVVFGIGGWKWTLPIFSFFVLSSALSYSRRSTKRRFDGMFEKGGTRDAGQVAANGGIAGLLALLWYYTTDERMYLLYLAALAVVTADTWGTETGVLSKSSPRSILSLRRVPTGTSGGVSTIGTAGGAIGAVVVLSTALLFTPSLHFTDILLLAALGVVGSAVDSLLGATLQSQYCCTSCSAATEKREHCGEATLRTRGLIWMNNDAVNLLSTAIIVIIAALAFMVR